MKILKNEKETKQVRILETNYSIIACFAQLTKTPEGTKEDLIEMKSFSNYLKAERWAKKLLNNQNKKEITKQ